MPNAVMHFEIYAEHPATLADFYQGLFWWTINKAPGIDYYMIQTAPTDARGISGGLTYRPIPEPRSWVHYVSVESLDQTIESVPPQVCYDSPAFGNSSKGFPPTLIQGGYLL